jgi:hypothetical protein
MLSSRCLFAGGWPSLSESALRLKMASAMTVYTSGTQCTGAVSGQNDCPSRKSSLRLQSGWSANCLMLIRTELVAEFCPQPSSSSSTVSSSPDSSELKAESWKLIQYQWHFLRRTSNSKGNVNNSSRPVSILQEETDPFLKYPRVDPFDCLEIPVRYRTLQLYFSTCGLRFHAHKTNVSFNCTTREIQTYGYFGIMWTECIVCMHLTSINIHLCVSHTAGCRVPDTTPAPENTV